MIDGLTDATFYHGLSHRSAQRPKDQGAMPLILAAMSLLLILIDLATLFWIGGLCYVLRIASFP